MLEFLKKVNDFLETVPTGMLNFFKKAFKAGETYVQEQVDIICRWAAWRVNITIERLRQKVIKTLYEQYSKYLILLQAGQVIQNFLSDPLGTIGDFASNFFKPFTKVKEFIQVVVREVPRLAENLANIANSLPPEPPDPHINFNAFELKINTITMKDVMKGPNNMPTPEEMFPEPEKPFGKTSFDAAFDNAKAKTDEEKVVYKLPPEEPEEETALERIKREDAEKEAIREANRKANEETYNQMMKDGWLYGAGQTNKDKWTGGYDSIL